MIRRIVLLITLAVLAPALAGSSAPNHSESLTDCRSCHLCDNPTRQNPCLRGCPRHDMLTVAHSADEGPDLLVLDKLARRYEPVVFTHRRHAEMAAFADGCATCHHHNPELGISACEVCHEQNPRRADLSRPSLRGAYHRQCMGCHREWSHDTACSVCHALQDDAGGDEPAADATDIVGAGHPEIVEPEKVIFETESEMGCFVSFHHNDHTGRFGLACTDCHREESCSRCHDRTPAAAAPAGPDIEELDFDTIHRSCFACHADDDCEQCHREAPHGPFDHATDTGWALGHRHESLGCRRCHGEGPRFTALDRRCETCHLDWQPGRFDHAAVTGQALDDNHADLECEMCHEERAFAEPPACDYCHDETSVPAQRPGRLVPGA